MRAVLWDAGDAIARDVRALAAAGADQRVLLDVVRAAYELDGPALTARMLRHRVRRGPGLAWRALSAYATRGAEIARIPGVYEFDLVGTIAFRELHYGAPPDGLPLDPALTYAPLAARFPAFAGEPYDLPARTPGFPWPLVVLSGDRDLRTPSAIAERVAGTARAGVLVRIRNGHSALDTHPLALLNATRRLVRGQAHLLPGDEPALERLPRRGLSARLPAAIRALARLDAVAGG